MASFGGTATRTGMANQALAYNVTDAEFDRVIAAYQQDANTSINGTATRNQVLAYMFNILVKQPIIEKLYAKEVDAAVTTARAGVSKINPT